jgi:methionyl-tRNA formyltransferase
MRIGILAHSFPSAFALYKAVDKIPEHEVFIILSPPPHRSAWTSYLTNLVRLVQMSLKGFDSKPFQLLVARRLVQLRRPLHHVQSVETLKKLNLDVGLHKTGVIYRDVTINAFRLGILNHHIGILPAYRGRSVMEWSILQGDPAGITVFFIDSGIDTGSRIVLSEQVDVSSHSSITAAKQYLFSLDSVFFPKALALINNSAPTFQLNDGSGKRYFVMSKLFEGVVEQLLKARN